MTFFGSLRSAATMGGTGGLREGPVARRDGQAPRVGATGSPSFSRRELLAAHALVEPHRLHHVGGGHDVVGDLRILVAADRGVDGHQDQHQHRRQKVDGDRARP